MADITEITEAKKLLTQCAAYLTICLKLAANSVGCENV